MHLQGTKWSAANLPPGRSRSRRPSRLTQNDPSRGWLWVELGGTGAAVAHSRVKQRQRHDCTYAAQAAEHSVHLRAGAPPSRSSDHCQLPQPGVRPQQIRPRSHRRVRDLPPPFQALQSSPEARAATPTFIWRPRRRWPRSAVATSRNAPGPVQRSLSDPAAAKRLWQLSTRLCGLDVELPTV
jgi:hypothetical protein